jgi:hypothetical protein
MYWIDVVQCSSQCYATIVRISYQVQYLVTVLAELLQRDSAPWCCSTTKLDT